MKTYTKVFETVLETDEIISPEEFLARRKAGTVRPENVEIALPTPEHPWGSFKVKLASPRYRVRQSKEGIHVFG